MSGGSYDYSFELVNDMANRLATSHDPLRVAFSEHLAAVAKAMHDVEWVDSGDYGPGDDVEAIRVALGPIDQQILDAVADRLYLTVESLRGLR